MRAARSHQYPFDALGARFDALEARFGSFEQRLVEIERRRSALRPGDAALLHALAAVTAGTIFSARSALHALRRGGVVDLGLIDTVKQFGKWLRRMSAVTDDTYRLVCVGRARGGMLWLLTRK